MARGVDSALVVADERSGLSAIRRFAAYPKLMSWALLHAAGLPALAGVAVTSWDSSSAAVAVEFATRHGGAVLIRSDAASETGRSPRGGYVVPVTTIENEVRRLLASGRVAFLLEPLSPFDDLYSMSIGPDRTWRHWLLEVVGGGFDASDLKRGDVTPHERIDAIVDDDGIRITSRTPAPPAVFTATREIRLRKIARLLECHVDDVPTKLQGRRETLLLEHPTYRAVPNPLVVKALRGAAKTKATLREHGLRSDDVVFSLSFLGVGARLTFWDIVWPHTKYLLGDAAADTPGAAPA